MGVDGISTYLLFAEAPDRPLGCLLTAAIKDGWEVEWSEHKDGYEFLSNHKAKVVDEMETVVSLIDEQPHSSVWIENEQARLCLESEAVRLPDDYAGSIRLWANKYDGFFHEDSPRTQKEARETVEAYLELVGHAVEATDPSWGFGRFGYTVGESRLPTPQQLREGYTGALAWLTIFEESAVEQIGREHLLSTPSYFVREFKTGHAMVVLSDNPIEPAEEFENTGRRAREHLGLEQRP